MYRLVDVFFDLRCIIGQRKGICAVSLHAACTRPGERHPVLFVEDGIPLIDILLCRAAVWLSGKTGPVIDQIEIVIVILCQLVPDLTHIIGDGLCLIAVIVFGQVRPGMIPFGTPQIHPLSCLAAPPFGNRPSVSVPADLKINRYGCIAVLIACQKLHADKGTCRRCKAVRPDLLHADLGGLGILSGVPDRAGIFHIGQRAGIGCLEAADLCFRYAPGIARYLRHAFEFSLPGEDVLAAFLRKGFGRGDGQLDGAGDLCARCGTVLLIGRNPVLMIIIPVRSLLPPGGFHRPALRAEFRVSAVA